MRLFQTLLLALSQTCKLWDAKPKHSLFILIFLLSILGHLDIVPLQNTHLIGDQQLACKQALLICARPLAHLSPSLCPRPSRAKKPLPQLSAIPTQAKVITHFICSSPELERQHNIVCPTDHIFLLKRTYCRTLTTKLYFDEVIK